MKREVSRVNLEEIVSRGDIGKIEIVVASNGGGEGAIDGCEDGVGGRGKGGR